MTLAKQNNNYPEPKKPTLIELAESVKDIVANFEEALENNDLEVAHEYEQRLQSIINNFGDKLESCYFAA